METEYEKERKREYDRTRRALGYAMECLASADEEGERIALAHGVELMLDLLAAVYGKGGDWRDAVEQHGVRDMQGAVQDIPKTGTTQEEGSCEAHVVPLVQGGDEAPGAVLSTSCLACRFSRYETWHDGDLLCRYALSRDGDGPVFAVDPLSRCPVFEPEE